MNRFKRFKRPGILNWLIALLGGAVVATVLFLTQSFFTGLYFAKLEESLRYELNRTDFVNKLINNGSLLQVVQDKQYRKLFPTENIVIKRFFGALEKLEGRDFVASFLALQDPVLKTSLLAQSSYFQDLLTALQKIIDLQRMLNQQPDKEAVQLADQQEFDPILKDVVNNVRGCLIALGMVRDLSDLTVSSYNFLKLELTKFDYNFPELYR
jgi:hypothetical protein